MNCIGCSYRLAILAISACFATPAWAIATLPIVDAGSVSINVQGNTIDINTSLDAALVWEDFYIGAAEIVSFNQPGFLSTVNIRSSGSNPATILGTLRSNGGIFLTNPSGFVFGANSLIQANHLGFWGGTDIPANFNPVQPSDLPPAGGSLQITSRGGISLKPGGNLTLVANPSVIPEPRSLPLMIAGLVMLGAVARYRSGSACRQ